MAQTLIRGTQIQPATIDASRLVSTLNLATTQLADGAKFIKSDGTVSMLGSLNMGGFSITSVGTPVNSTDAASKAYVDAVATGVGTFKKAVRALSISNIVTLSGLLTVDGVTLAVNDRVLLTGQTTASQNGLWVAGTATWTRPIDWAAGTTQPEGAYVLVDPDGVTYKNTKWFLSSSGQVTVDTTATTWAQDTTGTSFTNGNGLALTGTVFSVKAGSGIAFDGSGNVVVNTVGTGLLSASSSGLGITPAVSAGQVIVGNGSLNPAWVTASGDVSVSGTGVFSVNNTAGVGFLKYGNVVVGETPTGNVNGTNATFTLSATPQSGSLQLFYEGVLQEPGSGNDYTLSGNTITMFSAPLSGDKLRATYFK